MDKNSDNIQVMVRVRPLNSRERMEDAKSCVILDEFRTNCIILDSKPDQKVFNFDWIGGENTTQQNIFEVVGRQMVHTCLEGYNCCIFAYGQTGAGKTYTMQGRGLDAEDEDLVNRGLQPRVFDYIFGLKAKDTEENPDIQYLVSCTYLEIYNEQIMDLLEPVSSSLQIREDLKKGVYVEGLKEEVVENSEDTIELLRKGAINRHVGSTNMNLESSRSHSLFTMTIERKVNSGGTIHVRTSKFHFVDLAGSERQKQTAAAGDRLKEAGNINKSLSVLGQVINSLVEIAEGKQRHIRYRDSKLTFILKDSLGGNSKTSLIANISPASSSFAETLSTLKFAQRAKQIKNKASINEDLTGNVEGLKNEIRMLKEELARYRSNAMVIENEPIRKITPHTPIFFGSENHFSLMEQNQRSMEIEMLLKQTMDVLGENELLLQAELAKKEEYINIFKSAVELQESNELQYRSMLLLSRSKVERLTRALSCQVDELKYNIMLEVDNAQLKKENSCVLEIARNTPAVMRVFMDNVEMREKLDILEAEVNPNSSVSVARQLQENLVFLQELTLKIDENIRERKILSEKLEKMGPSRGGVGSPEKHKRLEDDIRQLKLDHSEHIDRLNYEILDLKTKETEARRIAEVESKKHFDLLREFEVLREGKQRNEEKYEKKIQELYLEFQQIQDARYNMDSLENTIDQLNLKNMEMKEQMNKYKEKYEEMMKISHEMEECVKTTLNQKDNTERELREELDKKNMEIGTLGNTITSLENRMSLTLEDFNKSKQEIEELTEKISDLYSKENEYKLNLDTIYHENIQLQDKLKRLEDQKNDELMQAQSLLEKEKMRLESVEVERSKIQEDLDTLNQTLNYNNNELDEKKNLLAEAQTKLSELEIAIQEFKDDAERKSEYIQSLEKQIHDQNQENSPFNLAIKENTRLKEHTTQLTADIKLLEIELQQKKDEAEKSTEKIAELSESVRHFSAAQKETFSQLELKTNEWKEVREALESKVAEFIQLEQELRFANDSTLQKESENVDLKNQINRFTQNIESLEKRNLELNDELTEKKRENTSLAEKCAEHEIKINELEASIQEKTFAYNLEIEGLKANLTRLEEETQAKGNQVEELSSLLKSVQEKNQSLEDTLSTLNKIHTQLQEEKTSIEHSLATLEEESTSKIQELQNSLANETNNLKNLQLELEEAGKKRLSLEEEIWKKDENLKLKENLIQENSQTIKEIEHQLSQSKENEIALRLDLETSTQKLSGLESQLREKETVFETQATNIAELENGLKESETTVKTLNDRIFDLEQTISGNQNDLNDKSLEIERQSTKISDLNILLSEKEQGLIDAFSRIDSEVKKVCELENNVLTLQNDLAKSSAEFKSAEQKAKEFEDQLSDLKQEITTSYLSLEEYNKTVAEMQKLLKEEREASNETLNKVKESLEKEQERMHAERNELLNDLNAKEQDYLKQIESLSSDLHSTKTLYSESTIKIKELQTKVENLHKEKLVREEEIKEYNIGMLQIKAELDKYQEKIDQLNSLELIQQENGKLKGELKKQDELIAKLKQQATEHFKAQEEEIAKIKESYTILENQHQMIMATSAAKENESAKSKEEIRLLLIEKDKLLGEIKKLKENEIQITRAKEECDHKINSINNEKLALLVQLDDLEKTNSQLAGHNNPNQKLNHLSKVKEENGKLRDEKLKLQEKLNKTQDRAEHLQKKLDELAKKNNIDPAILIMDLNETQYLQIELDKLKVENRLLNDVVVKMNEMLNGSIWGRNAQPPLSSTKDLSKTLENAQELLNILKNKGKEVHERERELEAKRLHYSILERELSVQKQKHQISQANALQEAQHSIENKENDFASVEKLANHKIELQSSKPFIQDLTGGKRSLYDLYEMPLGDSKARMKQQEKKTESDRKKKIEKAAGKISCGKILANQTSKQDPSEFLKEVCARVDDITNYPLLPDEEDENIKEKPEKKVKLSQPIL